MMDWNRDRRTHHMAGMAASLMLCVGIAGPWVGTSALAEPQQSQAAARADADIQTDVAYGLLHAPQLQGQPITAAAIMGEVTLSGTVKDQASKDAAQQIASGVSGVRSVSNNLTIGAIPTQQPADQTADQQTPPPPPYDEGVANPDQAEQQSQQPYPQQYPAAQGQNYPQPGPDYPQQNYPQPSYPQQPSYQSQASYPNFQQPSGPVTLPSGTLLTVRTSEPLDARKLQAGTYFQATAAADVYQGNILAIPRGAVMTGQVTGVKKPGDLAGKSGLQLQITAVSLNGQSFPLATDAWTSEGPGKGGYSAATTAGGAGTGALIGAIAGGGPGAAIGAVAGGIVGLAASAGTKGPQIIIPAEAVLSVHLTAPATVNPVSYQEAQRLASSVPQPQLVRRPVYRAYPYGYGYPYPYPYYRAYYYPRY